MAWYLDTSAFLKLIVDEDESRALRAWYRANNSIWSSQLLRTEALRARFKLGLTSERIQSVLSTVSLILPNENTFFEAGMMKSTALRSLDALHLATARELGGDLKGIVTYDLRLIEAASLLGIQIISPN
ncbi:MAG: type II toxin-antitoxin system VapC family toxin [Acidimicrobiales bacterium]|nr:type II toxin-antitoxin system VapC family toxin [Acidimicrobiales bacterium]